MVKNAVLVFLVFFAGQFVKGAGADLEKSDYLSILRHLNNKENAERGLGRITWKGVSDLMEVYTGDQSALIDFNLNPEVAMIWESYFGKREKVNFDDKYPWEFILEPLVSQTDKDDIEDLSKDVARRMTFVFQAQFFLKNRRHVNCECTKEGIRFIFLDGNTVTKDDFKVVSFALEHIGELVEHFKSYVAVIQTRKALENTSLSPPAQRRKKDRLPDEDAGEMFCMEEV